MKLRDPRVRDERVAVCVAMWSEADSGRRQHDPVGVRRDCVCRGFVQRPPRLVAPPELGLVLREGPTAVPHALPRGLDLDVEMDDERVELPEQISGLDRTSPDRDDRGLAPSARVTNELRLELAERRLAPLGEELPDRPVRRLDLAVDVVEGAAQALRDLLAERRLPRAHVAHEHEMAS